MPLPSPVITSRRQTLGLALLSMVGLHHAATAEAKNRKKRKKDKCDRKVERGIAQTCARQVDICVPSAEPICGSSRDPEACLAAVRECCTFMGSCDLEGYLACMEAKVAPLIRP